MPLRLQVRKKLSLHLAPKRLFKDGGMFPWKGHPFMGDLAQVDSVAQQFVERATGEDSSTFEPASGGVGSRGGTCPTTRFLHECSS